MALPLGEVEFAGGSPGIDHFIGLGEERLQRLGQLGILLANGTEGKGLGLHLPLFGQLQLNGVARGEEKRRGRHYYVRRGPWRPLQHEAIAGVGSGWHRPHPSLCAGA